MPILIYTYLTVSGRLSSCRGNVVPTGTVVLVLDASSRKKWVEKAPSPKAAAMEMDHHSVGGKPRLAPARLEWICMAVGRCLVVECGAVRRGGSSGRMMAKIF